MYTNRVFGITKCVLFIQVVSSIQGVLIEAYIHVHVHVHVYMLVHVARSDTCVFLTVNVISTVCMYVCRG